jgi:hypothetical protein
MLFFVVPRLLTKAPVTPPFADVLNAYMRHFVRWLHSEPDMHEELEKVQWQCWQGEIKKMSLRKWRRRGGRMGDDGGSGTRGSTFNLKQR